MKKNALIFSIGSILYPVLEILWRGRSHYSMAIAGGLSLMFIDIICLRKLSKIPLWTKAVLSSGIITSIEFFTGVIVNLGLKMNVWDYSGQPFNILGQICLPFSVIWILISLPAMYICKMIDRFINKYGLTQKGSAQLLFPDSGQ